MLFENGDRRGGGGGNSRSTFVLVLEVGERHKLLVLQILFFYPLLFTTRHSEKKVGKRKIEIYCLSFNLFSPFPLSFLSY